jgi:hypothetical protein
MLLLLAFLHLSRDGDLTQFRPFTIGIRRLQT